MARWIESLSEGHIVKVADDLPLPEGWAERDDTEPTEDVAALLDDNARLSTSRDERLRLSALDLAIRHGQDIMSDADRFEAFLRDGSQENRASTSFQDVEYSRNGVCLLCGDGVLSSGEHIDPDRHAQEVEKITSNPKEPNHE